MNCRNELQKPQNFGSGRESCRCRYICRKNAESEIEILQISTKLDAEKHRYDGFTRNISAAEVVWFVRYHPPNPPNSWSIVDLQKNCADAECRADQFAESYAENIAPMQINLQVQKDEKGNCRHL